MNSIGYVRSNYDHCVYMNGKYGKDQIVFLLYMDGILIAGKNKRKIESLKADLKSEFEMKDMGATKRNLGIDILRNKRSAVLFMS